MPPRRPSPLAPSQGSFPEATHVPRPPRSLPPPRAARRPANTRRTAGRSGVPPARHSRRGRRVLLGVRRQSLGQWHARGSPINEAVALPLARDLPAARLDARRRHGRRAGGAATSGRLHAKPRSPPPFPAPILAPPTSPSCRRDPSSPAHRSQRPHPLGAAAHPAADHIYSQIPPKSVHIIP
jgi:hypothetical protein